MIDKHLVRPAADHGQLFDPAGIQRENLAVVFQEDHLLPGGFARQRRYAPG